MIRLTRGLIRRWLDTLLHIEDTPAGYKAAVGPDVRVRLAYNQREAGQARMHGVYENGPSGVSQG